MRPHVVLAGGSGFIGQSLAAHLARLGIETIILSRSNRNRLGVAHWDGATLGDWARHLEGAAAVVNLTGRSVDCRYTPANRREIVESRVQSVRVLGEAVRRCMRPPRCWIQATSLALYGDAGDTLCHDDASPGIGFSVDVCKQWESAFHEQVLPNTRSVTLRIGFALAPTGGALGRLATLVRYGLGGTVGSGRQYISWLHIDDLNRLFAWSLENDQAQGVYNATGPSPIPNATFMAALRRALHRPWSPPVPVFAVRLGAYWMGTDPSLALTGRRCVPTRLLAEGFTFQFTDLDASLQNIFPTMRRSGN